MTLTDEQSRARDAAEKHLTSRFNLASPVLVLTGYAGTGKTTVLSSLQSRRVEFCAPTGKAAQVLRSKGIDASTLHQLIYRKICNNPLTFERRKPDEINCDSIVIDEASMVDFQVLKDLLSLRRPLLFVGDPFQLPPIAQDPRLFDGGYPTVKLETVHRQALDNPIVAFATWLRQNPGRSPYGWYDKNKDQDKVMVLPRTGNKLGPSDVDQIICGKNVTRTKINQRIRQALKYTNLRPCKGDKLICLRNDHERGICNGQQFLAADDATESHCGLTIIEDTYPFRKHTVDFFAELFDDPKSVSNPKACRKILTPLDYSYAITCHKSQGSEWSRVCVIDEPISDPPNRWRYTAATRAKETLHYFM